MDQVDHEGPTMEIQIKIRNLGNKMLLVAGVVARTSIRLSVLNGKRHLTVQALYML